jgi:hypothetical protein
MDIIERKEGIENCVTRTFINYSLFLLKFIKTMTLRSMVLEAYDMGMRDREKNQTGNVYITQRCGVFVQPLLHWRRNKCYIF